MPFTTLVSPIGLSLGFLCATFLGYSPFLGVELAPLDALLVFELFVLLGTGALGIGLDEGSEGIGGGVASLTG